MDEEQERQDYRNSLKNPDTLQFISINGSDEQKARAFSELIAMQTEAKTETKKSVRPSEQTERVPFQNKLVNQ